ncbi:DUF3973 domain-containing protein [Alicyclobacillus tolerans]|nr:DUF3973 domain-containing protein [Alicyclobacillus tolerans]
MYFCILCHAEHERQEADRVFSTGFRALPNGDKIPLGLCETSLQVLSKEAEKPFSMKPLSA